MEFIIFSGGVYELVNHPHLGVISVPTRLFVTDYTMVREFQTVEMRYNLSVNLFGNQQVITHAVLNRMVQLAEFLHEGKSEQEVWPGKFIRVLEAVNSLSPWGTHIRAQQEATAPSGSPIRTTPIYINNPYSQGIPVDYWGELPQRWEQTSTSLDGPETHLTPVTPTPVGRLAEEIREQELELLRRRLRNTIIPQER